jgi:predicted dehydrogenase
MTITRRQFVHASAAAAAAPLILTRPGAARRAVANEQITLAIIGTGLRAREILNGYLLGSERVRVLAVCDVDRTRREHHKGLVDEKYGNMDCAAYAADDEVYARNDIDAVIIATPDHWHATQCLHAAAAGKDIYCEKPLTHTLAEGQRLIQAVRARDIVFQTGSQQRSEYGHRFVRAAELVRAGRIGKLLNVNIGVGDPPAWCDLPEEEMEPGLEWDRWLGPAPERAYNSVLSPRGAHGHYPAWRRYREYSGGYLADMGAHHYDIAQWALGADDSGPMQVAPPNDAEAVRGATLRYAGGAPVTHGGPSGATFIGTEGMIHVDRGRLEAVPGEILETEVDEAQRLPRNLNHMENWLDCIHSRQRPICDVEVGARTAAVCQLVNIAYFLRRRLIWDAKQWRFHDAEANGLLDYERRAGYELPE